MVSEVVMYQSMFVIGILMFGFFTVTFSDFSDLAEETTLESNLQKIVDDIGNEIIDIITRGRELQKGSNSIKIDVDLQLDAEFSGKTYVINFGSDSSGISYIYATAGVLDKVYANYTLGFIDGSLTGQINFSGTLYSSSSNTGILYFWDSTPSETVSFT